MAPYTKTPNPYDVIQGSRATLKELLFIGQSSEKLSQREVARLARVSESTVSYYFGADITFNANLGFFTPENTQSIKSVIDNRARQLNLNKRQCSMVDNAWSNLCNAYHMLKFNVASDSIIDENRASVEPSITQEELYEEIKALRMDIMGILHLSRSRIPGTINLRELSDQLGIRFATITSALTGGVVHLRDLVRQDALWHDFLSAAELRLNELLNQNPTPITVGEAETARNACKALGELARKLDLPSKTYH